MPIYEYQCQVCGEKFSKFVRSLSAPVQVVCPRCGSEEVKKAISLFGVGSTDSAQAGASCSCGPIRGRSR